MTATLLGCSQGAQTPSFDALEHQAEIESWREERDQRLRQPDGWLTLAGLYWLENGDATFGSGANDDLVFPTGKIQESAGVLRRDGREVTLVPAPGAGMKIEGAKVSGPTRLALDTSDDGPTTVTDGSLSFYPIERGDMIGIRLKDSENPVLTGFSGMSYFPIDGSWRLVGRYERFAEPKVLRTPNVLGTETEEEIGGEVRFEFDGKAFSLQPSGDPAEGFFLVFGDRTNGAETYGGGRFLYTEPVAEDGSVVIDFNKAYCPPCVFTPYATCPLPPAANKLELRIEAGEKMFGEAH
jgi:uncharacterized protein (DUF1684 family)